MAAMNLPTLPDSRQESESALERLEIPSQWPPAVLGESARAGATADCDSARCDLRELPFVTIDGESARDFDDALYCERRGSGWRLWVAIADVASFVAPGSALDEEAAHRGTSVYLPQMVVPMLPEQLSNDLCSLRPDEARRVLVCQMDVGSDGAADSYIFQSALIKSAARLTYAEVASAISGGDGPTARCAESVAALHSLYRCLHRSRQRRGAMEFEAVEVSCICDAHGKPVRLGHLERNDAHRLVEECMLLANICAADFLGRQSAPGIYRIHQPPKPERVEELRLYLLGVGVRLGGGRRPGPADFQAASEALAGRQEQSMAQRMMLRCQQQARYQVAPDAHFGLAYDRYTHFTSPIRRYPDLLVHRAIRAALDGDRGGWYPYDGERLQALAESSSQAERRAERAERDIMQWLKCCAAKERIGELHKGQIIAVTDFGLFVELGDLYTEGLLHVSNLPGDYYVFESLGLCLRGRRTGRKYSLGDFMDVRIATVSLDTRRIDLACAEDGGRGNASRPSRHARRDNPNPRRPRRGNSRRRGRRG